MKIITPTIVVDISNAFTSGDSIGGKVTLTGVMDVTGGSAILDAIIMVDRANQKPVGKWYIFESDPVAATLTNNVAFVFSTDDIKVIAVVDVASGDWHTTNSKGVAVKQNLGVTLRSVGTKNLYATYVTTGTPTFSATTDWNAKFVFRSGAYTK